MAAKLKPPSEFDFKHPEKWSEWIRRFDRYRDACLFKEEEATQVNCLVYSMGEEAESIFPTLNLSEDDQKKYDTVKKAFTDYFVPKQNPVHWRCVLRQRFQQETENVETYLRALHDISDKCNYPTVMKNDEIRDQFVIGMKDKEVSKTLQSDAELTLDIATVKARQEEVLKMQLSSQSKTVISNAANIDAVSRNIRHQRPGKKPDFKPEYKRQNRQNCGNCGTKHPPRKCLAFNKNCNKCGKLGHFAQFCRSTKHSNHSKQYELSSETDDSNASSTLFMGEITGYSVVNPWYVVLNIFDTAVKFKIDSGADVNTVSTETYYKMHYKPELEQDNRRLHSVGSRVKTLGSFNCSTVRNGEQHDLRIYVVEGCNVNLLSRSTSYNMNLIKVNTPNELHDIGIT